MAYLLLMYQKFKLQRKENALTLKQLRFSSQVDRMQKKVDKRQKYYDKLKKQLERNANCYKNQMNSYFTQMAGLGMNSVNLMNPYGSNGAVMQMLAGLSAEQMNNMLGLDGKQNNGFKLNEATCNAIKKGTLSINQSDKDITSYKNKPPIKPGELFDTYTGDVIQGDGDNYALSAGQAYQQLQQMMQVQVSQRQQQIQVAKNNYENNVSIWLDAALEDVEAQEECEMDLLAEEQADMEADKASVELQLKKVQEEKQSIEQALGNAIKDSAPKFGLA